jgi:iron complex outermembrane receptor protein
MISTAVTPARATLALATVLSALYPFAAAAQDPVLPQVLVTASRFPNDPQLAPIGASTITAAEIRAAGIDNVNEAIRKIGGVYGRQSTSGTRDFDLDLRGFGTNSSQNLVILVDGVRISENELAGAALSAIPVDSVERIEIQRGGSSVLYGEGATGGVIQIVTKRGAGDALHGALFGEAGQSGLRQVRGNLTQRFGKLSVDAAAGWLESDGYRANNALEQKNFTGGLQWNDAGVRMGLRVESGRTDVRLAGSLTLAQFQADPRQTTSKNDYGSTDTDRVTGFAEFDLADWQVAAELSRRDKTARAFYDFGAFGTSRLTMDVEQTQFSPRVRHLGRFGQVANEFVAGLDFLRWNRTTDASYSKADTTQKSRALYLRDEARIGQARVAAGVRSERFDKVSNDPAPFTTATYRKRQNENAWELQGAYELQPALSLFAKAGKSYRLANADENGYTPVPNQPLDTQRSHDLELGVTYATPSAQATARVFRHKLRNEIYFDPTAGGGFGSNVNLDPTRRAGFELDGKLRVTNDLSLRGAWQHVNAEFTGGPNAGKEMVMVPGDSASLRANWSPLAGHTVDAGVQWASSQRYGADFTNTCGALIPAYTVLDARYGVRVGAWEFALAGNNLGNRHFFSNAFGCKSGIYPADGRQLKLSARVDF